MGMDRLLCCFRLLLLGLGIGLLVVVVLVVGEL